VDGASATLPHRRPADADPLFSRATALNFATPESVFARPHLPYTVPLSSQAIVPPSPPPSSPTVLRPVRATALAQLSSSGSRFHIASSPSSSAADAGPASSPSPSSTSRTSSSSVSLPSSVPPPSAVSPGHRHRAPRTRSQRGRGVPPWEIYVRTLDPNVRKLAPSQ
jgi:hypothetical protein